MVVITGKTYGTVGGAIEMETIQESKRLMTSGNENLLKIFTINDGLLPIRMSQLFL